MLLRPPNLFFPKQVDAFKVKLLVLVTPGWGAASIAILYMVSVFDVSV